MLAWVEFIYMNVENSPMQRFVREKNFLGNILTVSVVKDMKVIYGHEERRYLQRSPVQARDSYNHNPRRSSLRLVQQENHPVPSRTELLRRVLPSVVPDGLTQGSKRIRHIARGEHLCFTCLKPGHTRVECPTDPRFSTSSRHQASETRVSGLQIQVPNQPSTSQSFDDDVWDDPSPRDKRSRTLPHSGDLLPLMSLPQRPPTVPVNKDLVLEGLRSTALSSRCPINSSLLTSHVPSSSNASMYTPVSSVSLGLPLPTRLEFTRSNNLYFSEDDESMADAVRYPLSLPTILRNREID